MWKVLVRRDAAKYIEHPFFHLHVADAPRPVKLKDTHRCPQGPLGPGGDYHELMEARVSGGR
jgi:hypothetical protein